MNYNKNEIVQDEDGNEQRDTIFKNIIRKQFGPNGLKFITNLSALFAVLFVFILTVLIYMSVAFYETLGTYEDNKLNYPIVVDVPKSKKK